MWVVLVVFCFWGVVEMIRSLSIISVMLSYEENESIFFMKNMFSNEVVSGLVKDSVIVVEVGIFVRFFINKKYVVYVVIRLM